MEIPLFCLETLTKMFVYLDLSTDEQKVVHITNFSSAITKYIASS